MVARDGHKQESPCKIANKTLINAVMTRDRHPLRSFHRWETSTRLHSLPLP